MVKYNQLQYFDPDYGNSISNNADTRFSTEAKCAMGTLNRKHNCHTAPSCVYLLLNRFRDVQIYVMTIEIAHI